MEITNLSKTQGDFDKTWVTVTTIAVRWYCAILIVFSVNSNLPLRRAVSLIETESFYLYIRFRQTERK